MSPKCVVAIPHAYFPNSPSIATSDFVVDAPHESDIYAEIAEGDGGLEGFFVQSAVLKLHVVFPVDFYFARQFGLGLHRANRFADFVCEHESGFILNVEIARQLQRTVALRAVHKDRDGTKDALQVKLAAREDCAGRNRELRLAALALENLADAVLVNLDASALRAIGLSIVIGPADLRDYLADKYDGAVRKKFGDPY